MLIPFGILSSAAGVEVGETYELISTEILTASQASVTFSSLATYASTYKHLQIRMTTRDNRGGAENSLRVQFNADTASNYSSHLLNGNGSSVSSGSELDTNMLAGRSTSTSSAANNFGAGVIDILDSFSTTKNKTLRSLSGSTNDNRITLFSGSYRSTSALSQITLFPAVSGSFVTGCRFSLYGIRG
jgi:hypothetical protein